MNSNQFQNYFKIYIYIYNHNYISHLKKNSLVFRLTQSPDVNLWPVIYISSCKEYKKIDLNKIIFILFIFKIPTN